jgi:hypothetical protein
VACKRGEYVVALSITKHGLSEQDCVTKQGEYIAKARTRF